MSKRALARIMTVSAACICYWALDLPGWISIGLPLTFYVAYIVDQTLGAQLEKDFIEQKALKNWQERIVSTSPKK